MGVPRNDQSVRRTRLDLLLQRYEALVVARATWDEEALDLQIDRAVVDCVRRMATLCEELDKPIPESVRIIELTRRKVHGSRFSKVVFVAMPFDPAFDGVWRRVLREAVTHRRCKALRVDEIKRSESISQDVERGIRTSRALIADVTGSNPNVMFEVGSAHGMGKPLILISQSVPDLPFDIGGIRAIEYQDGPAGEGPLRKEVEAFLSALKAEERAYYRLFRRS